MTQAFDITPKVVTAHGLTMAEYERIIQYLSREPNLVELGVFSVMWSEHCSYKSSRVHLKKFPTKGPRVVQGPGENAGVVDIGDGEVVVFKMESHNHPSFIEPYQGAATGVGGILRDVFTMGARPVALLNSLRFGDLTHPKTKFLVEGVVSGIGGYGNCFGCPTVGGETYFHPSYNLNPLVNAFCLGIADRDKIFLGRAEGTGNPVIYVGSKTGRDGIHGATMASQEFDDNTMSKKPTVQVGDPFTEKLLLEACLELMKESYLVGIQDMGAAGLTSSSVEMAGRAGNGVKLDLSRVPVREEGMTPYELLLSESQERMLLVVKRGFEQKVKIIFDKWDLDSEVIGEVTDDGKFRALWDGKEVVCIPVQSLTEAAPVYERPYEVSKRDSSNASHLKNDGDIDFNDVVKRLISSPNLCSKQWIYRQYDFQVRTNTVVLPGADAAVIRIKRDSSNASHSQNDKQKALAITSDCNSRLCYLDPFYGGQFAVVEAARNLVCVGAEPIGLTDCLNFGNPEKKEVMGQFVGCVEGISSACLALGVPVVSGNVSFYNETNGVSIYPTPTIGMVGLLKDVNMRMGHGFKHVGDKILVLGETGDQALGGSEYLSLIYGREEGSLPKLNLELEKNVQKTVLELISQRLIHSAHDCSDGGLAVAVLESCFACGVGAKLTGNDDFSFWFNEAPSRVVVSVGENEFKRLEEVCQKNQIPCVFIGETILNEIGFNSNPSFNISELKSMSETAFEGHLGI